MNPYEKSVLLKGAEKENRVTSEAIFVMGIGTEIRSVDGQASEATSLNSKIKILGKKFQRGMKDKVKTSIKITKEG